MQVHQQEQAVYCWVSSLQAHDSLLVSHLHYEIQNVPRGLTGEGSRDPEAIAGGTLRKKYCTCCTRRVGMQTIGIAFLGGLALVWPVYSSFETSVNQQVGHRFRFSRSEGLHLRYNPSTTRCAARASKSKQEAEEVRKRFSCLGFRGYMETWKHWNTIHLMFSNVIDRTWSSVTL